MHARSAHGEHETEREKRERTRLGALPEERGHRAQTRPNAQHTRKRKRNAEKRKGRRASQRVFQMCKIKQYSTYLNDFNSSPTLRTNITITTKS